MNQMVSTAEIERGIALATTMTRRAKLARWATIIRQAEHPFRLYHRLEHYRQDQLDHIIVDQFSAFGLATRDPILRDAGLVGSQVTGLTTIGDTMRFFELTKEELHEFSCDCGGEISNAKMADGIEKIAGGQGGSGPLAYVRALFSR